VLWLKVEGITALGLPIVSILMLSVGLHEVRHFGCRACGQLRPASLFRVRVWARGPCGRVGRVGACGPGRRLTPGAQVKCVSCMLYLVAVFQACWLIRESPRHPCVSLPRAHACPPHPPAPPPRGMLRRPRG
jgi:hypothetical protein